MRKFVCLLACLLTAFAVALPDQEYALKPGDTILKLVIAGRGNIFVKLYTKQAPKTTEHIIDLAKGGFYDGQRFHRVVRSPRPFIAQVGDPASKDGNLDDPKMGDGGSGKKVPYENSGLSNEEGSVSLASPAKDKNAGDSQFFFVLASSKFLDGKYTVFGKVVAGLDVMRTIQRGDRVESAAILTK